MTFGTQFHWDQAFKRVEAIETSEAGVRFVSTESFIHLVRIYVKHVISVYVYGSESFRIQNSYKTYKTYMEILSDPTFHSCASPGGFEATAGRQQPKTGLAGKGWIEQCQETRVLIEVTEVVLG